MLEELSEEYVGSSSERMGTKLLKNYCLPRRSRSSSWEGKSRSRIASCRCWLAGWNHRSLQQWPQSSPSRRKLARETWLQVERPRQPFTKKNKGRPRRIWPDHAGCGCLGTNGIQKCASLDHRRQGSSAGRASMTRPWERRLSSSCARFSPLRGQT